MRALVAVKVSLCCWFLLLIRYSSSRFQALDVILLVGGNALPFITGWRCKVWEVRHLGFCSGPELPFGCRSPRKTLRKDRALDHIQRAMSGTKCYSPEEASDGAKLSHASRILFGETAPAIAEFDKK